LPSGSDRDNHPDGRSSVTMGACPREGSRARLVVVDLLPGVRSSLVDTDRIRMRVLEAGPADGEPVVLVHGNLSTARFYEHLMPELPSHYRVIAPDMRGFGGSDPAPLDATRGLADWADDTAALLRALGVTAPPHLVGWSTGGAAIARFARDRPVASLTFLDPVSPYGYGGTHPDGTPCFPDGAGSGGGGINPEVVARLRAGDTTADSPFTARSMFRAFYVAPGFAEPREDLLVDEILTTHLGDTNYPGDATTSENWPGFAPGPSGILNALSPRYCRWDDIVDLDPKPPVLWTHGAVDLVVADGSPLELGTLGASGAVPGWPGAEVYPPQPMVAQIRAVLDRYAAAGGSVRVEIIEGAGHGPHLDAAPRWLAIFRDFLATIG
jgi:pimeloyl-ACP methyl ester carboxylesterase